MSGFTDYTSKNAMNYLSGLQTVPAMPAVFAALFTAVGTDAGTGFTEVSGGSYARTQVAGNLTTNGTTTTASNVLHFASVPAWIVAGMACYDVTVPAALVGLTVVSTTGTTVTLSGNVLSNVGGTDSINFSAFAAAAGSAPSSITSSSAVTFPLSTGSWGTVIAFGLYDASSSGNLLGWDYLGAYGWLPATVSSASPGILTVKGHGYSAADNVVFSTEYGGTAPTFSQSNFTGLLAVVSPATDSFSVTNAATAVNTSSTGSGMVRKVASQSIPNNITTVLPAGQLVFVAA